MKPSLKILSFILSLVAIGVHYMLVAQDISPLAIAVTFLPFMPLFLFLPAIMWAVIGGYAKQLPLVDFVCHVSFYLLWVLAGFVFLNAEWGVGKFAGYISSALALAACISVAVGRSVRESNFKEWLGRHKRALSVFGALTAVLLLTYVMVDVPAQAQFKTAHTYIATVDQSVLTAGGHQVSVSVQGNGSAWQRYGCDLFYSCPFVAGEWVVPVEASDKLALARELFAKTNFPHGAGECYGNDTQWFCYIDGRGDDFKLTIELWENQQSPDVMDTKLWAHMRATLQAGAH